jgi:hypothetical protein
MFDANKFKRLVKEWIRENPEAELAEFQDFCEDLIPPAQFSSYQWLVDQTVDWYKHILAHREVSKNFADEGDEHSIA